MDLDNDEDTETTDSESESSKDVMSEPGWIHYQPPTYSRQAYPRFPYELIERIMDFLWDDPGAFAGCCLVCHAWYCATRPLFPTMTDRKFTDKTRFMQFVRLLARPRNWPYFKAQLTSLELHRQFAHSWVMHIPVCLLPQIMRLTFCDVDWATINPHPQHFLRLSHCKDSLQFLALYRCRFRSTLDLRRMINALPNLSDVTLDAITFQHPSPPRTDLAMSTVKMAHHKLRGMRIWNPCYDATNSIASGRVRLQGFLDLCSAYPAINDLSFDLWHFTSLPEIEDYLRRFRNLSSLSIHLDCADDTYPDLKSAPVDMAAGGHTDPVHPLRYSLSEIKIGFVSSRCALQLLTLVSPRTCHPRLRTLVIKLADPPCAELIAKVTNILQISGAVLEAFDWRHGSGGAFEAVPRLSANTALKELDMILTLPSSPQIIQRTLEALLSDITSPHLRRISLYIWLNQSDIIQDANEVRSASPADTTKYIPTFHAILSRGIYAQLPKNSVDVRFDLWGSSPEVRHVAVMSQVKSHLVILFAPWLYRGVLELTFSPDPDIARIFGWRRQIRYSGPSNNPRT